MMRSDAVKIPGNYYFDPAVVPLALKKVRGSLLSHPHDYTGIPHWHDFTELVIITGGHGRQLINGTSYPVSAGDVFVITGRTTHCFEDHARLEITNIMFDERLLDGAREYLNRIPGYHVVFRFEPELRNSGRFHNMLRLSVQDLARVVRLASAMEMELEGRFPGSEAAAAGKLLELTVFLSRALNNGSGGEVSGIAGLAALFSALESSFQEQWTLRRMAKYCGMSVNTLLRKFRAAAHRSPLQHLTQLRLNAARHMLEAGEMTVSEIAFACGFRDSNYFSKCFSKHFRAAPSSFRKSASTPDGGSPADRRSPRK